MLPTPTLREMMNNGVHFGHVSSRWNPKMKKYIYGERDHIHIINLERTKVQLDRAITFLTHIVEGGGIILFVGTKRQAKPIVKAAAEACGMPYAVERWFGGALTNFTVMRQNIKILSEMEQSTATERTGLTKKERLRLTERRAKMQLMLEGLRDLNRLPDALFVVDAPHEHIAIMEALSLHIPIVAVVDTNANPEEIDYPIPANDDAARSLTLLLDSVSAALQAARILQPADHAAKKIKDMADAPAMKSEVSPEDGIAEEAAKPAGVQPPSKGAKKSTVKKTASKKKAEGHK